MEELRKNSEEIAKKLNTNEGVVQWLNKQLNMAQKRDPGLRLGPPPAGLQFSNSEMASTSTPMPRGKPAQNQE